MLGLKSIPISKGATGRWRSYPTLVHVIACFSMAPNHYPNQCCIVVHWNQGINFGAIWININIVLSRKCFWKYRSQKSAISSGMNAWKYYQNIYIWPYVIHTPPMLFPILIFWFIDFDIVHILMSSFWNISLISKRLRMLSTICIV